MATHGREAVEKATKGGFDGILMDVQMPVMDGYQATRLLRADPAYDGTPIIAMTANAMPGDKTRCMAAGMVDYISKPLDAAAMYATLAKWVRPWRPAPETSEKIALPGPVSPPFSGLVGLDTKNALARMGNSEILYRNILGEFVSHQAGVAAAIRSAWRAGEQEHALRLAHTLKGIAGTIGAEVLSGEAAALESGLRYQPQKDPEPLLTGVVAQLQPVLEAIARLPVETEAGSPAPQTAEKQDVIQVTPLMKALQQLLADDDTAAIGQVRELEKQLVDPQDAAQLQRLAVSISQYEFEEALATLKAMSQKLGVSLS